MKLFCLIFIYSIILSTSYGANTDLPEALINIKQKYEISGLTGALSINGNMIEIAATGLRKIDNEAKLETSDKFHIGSCTKAITATLAATFVEEGKVNWKSKLSEIFPDLRINEALKDITFDEILAHRSGLLKDPEDDLYEMLQMLETSEARKVLTQIFLEQDPSHKPLSYNYSNVGYIIIGYILEKIGGKNWETLINERIFSPLNMTSCGFGPTSDPLQSIVSQPWGHFKEDGVMTPVHFDNAPFYGPAGTIHCSLTDWSKFLDMHVQGFNGKGSVLKAETFNKLHTPYPEKDETYTYGAWIRLEKSWAEGPVLTHSGSNVVNLANVWLAPKKQAVLMSTTNTGGQPSQLATNDVIIELIMNHLKSQ